jgi:hypothetical protein
MWFDGGNRPLGVREEEERMREAVAVKKEEWNVLTDPLHGIYGMVLPSGVSGHKTGVSGSSRAEFLVKDRIEFW